MGATLAQSIRGLSRAPAFALTTVGSVALAIGLACSVFAVAEPDLFPTAPYPDPDRLVQIWSTERPGSEQPNDYLGTERMRAWSEADWRHLDGLAGRGFGPALLLEFGAGTAEIEVEPIVGDWFGTLGVSPRLGRSLNPGDVDGTAPPAMVLSHTLWRDVLGGAPELIGESLTLAGITFSLVGVMPASFEPVAKAWVSAHALPNDSQPAAYAGVARLRDGSSVRQATQEAVQRSIAEAASDPTRYGESGATVRLLDAFGGRDASAVWLVLGVVGGVLIVGISNLTHLFMTRANRLSPGLAIRASLGANRAQLGAGLLIESVVLVTAGGTLGLLLAVWGKDLFRALLPGVTSSIEPVTSPTGVAFGVSLSLIISGAVATIPLRRLDGLNLSGMLNRASASGASTSRDRRLRSMMVSSQVAVSMLVVVAGGILNLAWYRFRMIDPGYDARQVVRATPDWNAADMDADAQWAVARSVAERLRERPEIAAGAMWRTVAGSWPPSPEFAGMVEGQAEPVREGGPVSYYEVEPGTVEALGVPLVRGRTIGGTDLPDADPVVLVSRSAAGQWWPNDDPLGKRIKLGTEGVWLTVVGITEDMQTLSQLGRASAVAAYQIPTLFVPARQQLPIPPGWRASGNFAQGNGVNIAARAPNSSESAVSMAKDALRAELEPLLPAPSIAELHTLYEVQTSGYYRDEILVPARLAAVATVVALALALLGVGGLVADGVAARTREIGVRVALGARSAQVLFSVSREALTAVLIGLVLGAVSIFGLHQVLAAKVFSYMTLRLGGASLQPALVLGATAGLLLVSVGVAVACALRALKVDPVEALRCD